jgi:hypothetical protein
MYLGDGSEL